MEYIRIIHSILRWGVLLFGVWTVINAISGISSKRAYSKNDNTSNLLFMIFCDIQLLLGFLLFFIGPWWEMAKLGMGNLMKDGVARFFTMEHGLMMIIAWILVHIGRTSVKRAPEASKHKKMLIFFGLALLIILASIPWPFRADVGRPFWPSM